MPDETPARPRRFGPFLYSPKKGSRGDYFHVKAASLVGLLLVVVHDGVYRQTQPQGEGDFELFGTISHAGLDMLGTVIVIATTLVLVEWGRIR